MLEFFDFENFVLNFCLPELKKHNFFGRRKAGTRERGNNGMREQQNEGTAERGDYWNDTTSALFKNLV
jgi:hypothetical protein